MLAFKAALPRRRSTTTFRIREDSVAASVFGIDIGIDVFHFVGFSADGQLVLRQKIKFPALDATFNKLSPRIVGMEACLSAHWDESLAESICVLGMMAASAKFDPDFRISDRQ
jgi:hypothetical protein